MTALTFTWVEPDDDFWEPMITATIDGRVIGSLSVGIVEDEETDSGEALEISYMSVEPGHRRQGIATELVNRARERFPQLRIGRETIDGERFFNSYGRW